MLRIRNWDGDYENNRTRELKKLEWVPVPNQLDGDGYTELVDHPEGAAHLGAWLAIVQIASKCETRGTLSRKGARPHNAASLARISRIPVHVFEDVIPRLMEIGWLEELDDKGLVTQGLGTSPQDDAGFPQGDAGLSQDVAPRVRALREGNGREEKGMEGNGIAHASDSNPQNGGYGPGAIGDEAWAEFRSLGEQYGWKYSVIEWDEARQFQWKSMDFTQRLSAVAHLRSLIKAHDGGLVRAHPKNYLGKQMYLRAVGPPPQSTNGKPQQAEGDFMRRMRELAANPPKEESR